MTGETVRVIEMIVPFDDGLDRKPVKHRIS